ncbi:MAG: DNA-binding response regulator [Candidatus Scalindua sp. AMX11]|nr:MAG: DNA-binding response regulator [Candidatus Scalindua sp.]TDE65172.1 MAG: DNA-binding response regulator [Candidatus Scalindua sp. AMX11]GJQ58591.1 MAG: hypothetical protein SCALA701_13920 [Candidatus Scalindua sp.]
MSSVIRATITFEDLPVELSERKTGRGKPCSGVISEGGNSVAMKSVLVVEDDKNRHLRYGLESEFEGYRVTTVADGFAVESSDLTELKI